ncbi:polysaccharide deacetylase family protein [bacterium]|nr:polysaccharide deacetylase family protein [bacterium]
MFSDIFPQAASVIFPNVISRGDPDGIYLTFDDGPDPVNTTKLLSILNEYNCKATFFVIGTQADQYPDIIKQTYEAGHTVASHSYDHRSLVWAGRETVLDQINRSIGAISDAGLCNSRLFRPPYGRIGLPLLSVVKSLNMQIVLWSLSAGDYRPIQPKLLVERIVKKVKPGDIVLLHDKGNYVDNMLEALPGILRTLLDKGMSFKALGTGTCAV